jgi:hypothetical protein
MQGFVSGPPWWQLPPMERSVLPGGDAHSPFVQI